MGNAMKAGWALGLAGLASLTACGGNDGRIDSDFDADAEELFADYANILDGGYRSLQTPITDAAHTSSHDCGYVEALTLNEALDFVDEGNGDVTVSNEFKWCGETDDETLCLVRAGGSIVFDDLVVGNPSERYFEIVIPGLAEDARAYFSIDTDGGAGAGSADVERRVSNIPSNGNCTPSTSTLNATALNGSWDGWRVSYSRDSRTGAEADASMTCVSNKCTVDGESFGVIDFTSFKSNGSWQGTGQNVVASVSMIASGDAIAMYVCDKPLDEARIVDECVFYGLSKL